jgi:hypothetical protein
MTVLLEIEIKIINFLNQAPVSKRPPLQAHGPAQLVSLTLVGPFRYFFHLYVCKKGTGRGGGRPGIGEGWVETEAKATGHSVTRGGARGWGEEADNGTYVVITSDSYCSGKIGTLIATDSYLSHSYSSLNFGVVIASDTSGSKKMRVRIMYNNGITL